LDKIFKLFKLKSYITIIKEIFTLFYKIKIKNINNNLDLMTFRWSDLDFAFDTFTFRYLNDLTWYWFNLLINLGILIL